LGEAIRWSAKEEILFPVEDAAVGWCILGEEEEEGATVFQLLTVFVHADVIERLVRIARNAGLRIKGITVVPLALRDYDREANPKRQAEVTAYVDMGAERTRVYVFNGNRLQFSREIPTGGASVTQALVGEYATADGLIALSVGMAGFIKKTHGLPPENSEALTEEGIPLREIRERLLPLLSKQAEEIHRSLEYFRNQHKEDTLTRLVLAGGSSGLRGFGEFLGEQLSLPVEHCNALKQSREPVPGIDLDEVDNLGPELTVAAGLALGECRQIDVLPEKHRFSVEKLLRKLAPFAVIPVAIVVMIVLSLSLRRDLRAKELALKDKSAQVEQLQSAVIQAKIPLNQLAELEKQLEALMRERAQLPETHFLSGDIANILQEFARTVPATASLSRIAFKSAPPVVQGKTPPAGAPGGALPTAPVQGATLSAAPVVKPAVPVPADLKVEGNVFGGDTETLTELTRFVEELKRSALFREVQLINSIAVTAENYTHPGIEFEMSLQPVTVKPEKP
jgi:type IV pilus assembly protein PilM